MRLPYHFLPAAPKLVARGALLALLLCPLRSPAQATPAAPAPAANAITSVQAFWSLDNDAKLKPQRVRFDILVHYYDPAWQLLWGECEGRGSYLPVRGTPLPMRAGQLVRIEGTVVPARGLLRSEVKATVLKEDALPEPQPVAGTLDDADRFDARPLRPGDPGAGDHGPGRAGRPAAPPCDARAGADRRR